MSTKSPCPGQSLSNLSVATGSELASALEEARRMAAGRARPVSTVDVLLGVLRAGGTTARVLAERGISATAVELNVNKLRVSDAVDLMAIADMSRDIAAGLKAKQTTSSHLLLAILRTEGSATEALRLSCYDPAKLRGILMRSLTAPSVATERGAGGTPAGGTPAIGPTAPVSEGSDPQSSGSPSQEQSDERSGEDRAAACPDGWRLSAIPPPQVAVLHREREVSRLLDLLQAKTARVILVVGEPGSGRSALLSALSAVSLEPPLVPEGDLGAPESPGALLQMFHRRASLASPVVLDGAAWLGPEASDGALQLLATAGAGRRWIVVLTPADLRRLEIAHADLVHHSEIVLLGPPEPSLALEMIEAGLDGISATCRVSFAPEVAACLLRLSARYPSERAQPGRAIAIAEIAVARAERLSQTEVCAADIAAVVGDAAGIPSGQLLRHDDERFRGLEDRLAERVVGHADARTAIASALRRSYAGFRGRRPLASFLLLGPTGVGKTETARAIAEALFDSEAALVRIDLSEYSEAHSIARLIGSPPGYLAHEDGGQLTEAIRRRPASVVLLDELEKANRDVLLLLLQVLEDGRLTDGRGRTVDFSSAAIVMTSNLGSECYRRTRIPPASTMLALARSRLPPELWNRIDEVLCYAPLSDKELAAIVGRIARDSSRRLQAERGIAFEIEDSVIKAVLRRETDRSLGARPLRRAFERLVEGPLSSEIVSGRLLRGARLRIGCRASGRLEILDVTARLVSGNVSSPPA